MLDANAVTDFSQVERKDGSSTENINIQVHDDTAGATFGLWGTPALSPTGDFVDGDSNTSTVEETRDRTPWKAGKTVLLLESPGSRIGRGTYLNLTTTTIVDVDPDIADAHWLRRWASKQMVREAINPPFPEGVFDLEALVSSPLRCLYTFADLDDFARAAPQETFQGYLSVLIMEVRLLENKKRSMLMCGECCSMPVYGNATVGTCKGCDKQVELRLNPKIVCDPSLLIFLLTLLTRTAWPNSRRDGVCCSREAALQRESMARAAWSFRRGIAQAQQVNCYHGMSSNSLTVNRF